MAKVIAEKVYEQQQDEAGKFVEIKHTRTMQDAAGKDVEVVDFVEQKELDIAISDCEAFKAGLEKQITECDAELAEYIAIRDAE
jgi:hypothetical protein